MTPARETGGGSAVTREEFDALWGAVRELLKHLSAHRHDMHDIDGGGETLGLTSDDMVGLAMIAQRLDAVRPAVPLAREPRP